MRPLGLLNMNLKALNQDSNVRRYVLESESVSSIALHEVYSSDESSSGGGVSRLIIILITS